MISFVLGIVSGTLAGLIGGFVKDSGQFGLILGATVFLFVWLGILVIDGLDV